ncbi:MAG: hypothetical protein K8H88_05900, partial [Sandaracinaceae bacterium]|nr:hypothetical protein [Sandaracinaceae bacterium]
PILLATGGAALVAAAILGGVVLAQEGSLTSSCSGTYCPERARGLAAEVETLAITTDVLLLAGAAVTATGLVLSFALHDEAPALSAACGPSGCVLSGRF